MTTTISYTRVRLPETKPSMAAGHGHVISWGTEGVKNSKKKDNGKSADSNFSLVNEGYRIGGTITSATNMGSKLRKQAEKLRRSKNEGESSSGLTNTSLSNTVQRQSTEATSSSSLSSNDHKPERKGQDSRSKTDVGKDESKATMYNPPTPKTPSNSKGVNLRRMQKNSYEKPASGIRYKCNNDVIGSQDTNYHLNVSGNELPESPAVALAARQQQRHRRRQQTESLDGLQSFRGEILGSRRSKPKKKTDEASKNERDTKINMIPAQPVAVSKDDDTDMFPDDSLTDSILYQASQAFETNFNNRGSNSRINNDDSINVTTKTPIFLTSTPVLRNSENSEGLNLNKENNTPTTRPGVSRIRSRSTVETPGATNLFENSAIEDEEGRKPSKILKFEANESPIKAPATGEDVERSDVFGQFEEDDQDSLFLEMDISYIENQHHRDPQPILSTDSSNSLQAEETSEKSTFLVSKDSASADYEMNASELNEKGLKCLEEMEVLNCGGPSNPRIEPKSTPTENNNLSRKDSRLKKGSGSRSSVMNETPRSTKLSPARAPRQVLSRIRTPRKLS